MDCLAQLSISMFQASQRFTSPSPSRPVPAIEVAVVDRVGQFKEIVVRESDVLRWQCIDEASSSNDSPSERTLEASFKMIQINRNLDVSLEISRDVFCEFLDTMKSDPTALYLITHDYDGFHEFAGDSEHRRTWFVGNPIYAILWTFDDTAGFARTTAIYFRRRRNEFSAFGDVLQAFCSHAFVPQLLFMVISIHLSHWFDEEISRYELQRIRRIEDATGFGPQGSLASVGNVKSKQFQRLPYFSASNFDIDKLMEFSQGVNEVAGQLSNKLRHQRVLHTMLERLKTDAAGVLAQSNAASDDDLRALGAAVPTVLTRLNTYAEYLTYLRDRCERLSIVLFALLTHQDAAAAIDLGVASKRDTSAMKTIAIVTMAFLPATFIAALFAVPSLDWGGEEVISSRFWVYWAFTIPMTVLVFSIWLAITQRQWIVSFVRPAN